MIKQIQLRGISRSPSDRTTKDGGLSESLNMYLDSDECAPVIIPSDINQELGLPYALNAERMFIHKTATYENYIVLTEGRIVAYTSNRFDSDPLLVLNLASGETVSDIESIGNTLIISASQNLYYCLYKDNVYTYLGNQIPFPKISVYAKHRNPKASSASAYDFKLRNYTNEDEWNESTDEELIELTKSVWSGESRSLQKVFLEELDHENFTGPRFIQYAIETNTGELLASLPIAIGLGDSDIRPTIMAEEVYGSQGYIQSSLQYKAYSIMFKLINLEEFNDWKDVLVSIKIFVGDDMYLLTNSRDGKLFCELFSHSSSRDVALFRFTGVAPATEEMLEAGAITRLAHTIPFVKNGYFTEEISKLGSEEGFELIASPEFRPENLAQKDKIGTNNFANYPVISDNLENYNNRLIAQNIIETMRYSELGLSAPFYSASSHNNTYDVYFVVPGYEKDKCFKATIEDPNVFFGGLIMCPEQNCKKVIVVSNSPTKKRYGEFDAIPHPILNCSYVCTTDSLYDVGNIDASLSIQEIPLPTINNIKEKDNQLLISPINNPFVFPLESRYSFQSKIIGVAVASAALSQGQFGQFPLYVFTDDGIWVMETAADGSFVSSKPLSREVCSNPDSITSIDNAVVFVTKKGVMLIQGANIVTLSPYMNGRHYAPNEDATILIGKHEEFSGLLTTIEDKSSFISYVQTARVAHDYTGQRLIFISPDNKEYQYVYKIDTQTWHKMSLGIDILSPLNSYPECFVMGNKEDSHQYWEIGQPYLGRHFEEIIKFLQDNIPYLSYGNASAFLKGENFIDVSYLEKSIQEVLFDELLYHWDIETSYYYLDGTTTKIFNLNTILSPDEKQKTSKGIIITRPFDLGETDIYKTIKKVKIRGDYDKDNVKYFLQGSDDGRTFYNLTSLRGKSWKVFRLFILADLEPTERISWVDIEYETRFMNRLR